MAPKEVKQYVRMLKTEGRADICDMLTAREKLEDYLGLCKTGKPREHNRDQIALDMLDWAKLDTSMNFNEFCATYKPPIPPQMLTKYAHAEELFGMAFQIAKAYIAVRREMKLTTGELHIKAYDLNAAVYDYFIKNERREEKEFEVRLSKEDQQVDQEILSKTQAIHEQMAKLRQDLMERKIEDTKRRDESKS